MMSRDFRNSIYQSRISNTDNVFGFVNFLKTRISIIQNFVFYWLKQPLNANFKKEIFSKFWDTKSS